ncbi:hypothetical protein RvY_07993 [Ramazzottius varieornatus]|uniref:Uncharacterized protein n=1 Tax=Ramazzottius varieornatus TaxID=947166 RepID=A0A1D1VCF2_RAMVA|nr:hypothetical protein RvY_07993 [Ramazzottius varieornatus]
MRSVTSVLNAAVNPGSTARIRGHGPSLNRCQSCRCYVQCKSPGPREKGADLSHVAPKTHVTAAIAFINQDEQLLVSKSCSSLGNLQRKETRSSSSGRRRVCGYLSVPPLRIARNIHG